MDENIVTPAGLKNRKAVLNINRGRARARYIRPDDGRLTTLLPADPFSIAYYAAKGFRLPSKDELKAQKVNSTDIIECPICGFVAKSNFGLQAHQRKHKKEEK